MNISELKTGWLVRIEEGRQIGLVLMGTGVGYIIAFEDGTYLDLIEYDEEDMTHDENDEFDIMQVFSNQSIPPLLRFEPTVHHSLIWDRGIDKVTKQKELLAQKNEAIDKLWETIHRQDEIIIDMRKKLDAYSVIEDLLVQVKDAE